MLKILQLPMVQEWWVNFRSTRIQLSLLAIIAIWMAPDLSRFDQMPEPLRMNAYGTILVWQLIVTAIVTVGCVISLAIRKPSPPEKENE